MIVVEDISNHTYSGFSKDSTVEDVKGFYGRPEKIGRPKKNFMTLRFAEADVTFYKNKLYSITQYNSVFPEYSHSSFRDERSVRSYISDLREQGVRWTPNKSYSTDTSDAISIGGSTIVIFDKKINRVYSVTQLYK
jgi:hypothetical protein